MPDNVNELLDELPASEQIGALLSAIARSRPNTEACCVRLFAVLMTLGRRLSETGQGHLCAAFLTAANNRLGKDDDGSSFDGDDARSVRAEHLSVSVVRHVLAAPEWPRSPTLKAKGWWRLSLSPPPTRSISVRDRCGVTISETAARPWSALRPSRRVFNGRGGTSFCGGAMGLPSGPCFFFVETKQFICDENS